MSERRGPETFMDLLDGAYQRLQLPQRNLGITPDEIILASYCDYVRKQLGSQFIITPDLKSKNGLIIPADGLAKVQLDIPDDILPIKDYHPYARSVLKPHTRSRFAQLGLHVTENSVVGDTVMVRNLAPRPFAIDEGQAFCCLYYFNGDYLTGEELAGFVGTEEGAKIRLSGEEGKDWKKWYGDAEPRPENLQGIELMIDPKRRWSIMPGESPIYVPDGEAKNHSRGYVDHFLYQLQISEEAQIWISESAAKLLLDPSVNGILQWWTEYGAHDFQTNSILFKGGNTYGRQRYEIYSPTTEDRSPKSLVMKFAKAA